MSSPLAIVQNAYVVASIEAACERFHRLFGIGPFIGGSEGVLAEHIYRGEPAEPIRIRGVFVQSGSLNIELVEVLSEGPSAFRDMFAAGEEGLHHCALFAEDYDAAKQRFIGQGFDVVSEFAFSGRRICYVDTRPVLGHMIEIYPELPLIHAMYAEPRDAAAEEPGDPSLRPWRSR